MKINELFDFIAGTSTGSILTLSLALGRTTTECRQLYFRLKDKVFIGSRPYESEPFERFLQKEFGNDTKMSDIKKPRVVVTATVADKFPPDLHLFRNYLSPEDLINNVDIPSSDQLLWQAARSSGAAPTYFRSSGRFIDGGLISNNPTLDSLTEIHQLNAVNKSLGRDSDIILADIVVSVGTGVIPVVKVPSIDVFRPDSIFGVAKIAFAASSLGQLLIEQASQANGQVVERAKAWCGMINVPFFRLNPPISQNVPLDEVSDAKLVAMLWETTAYMNTRLHQVSELVELLK